MKILQILSSTDPKLGGVVHAVQTLAAELERAQMEVEVVSLDDPLSNFQVNTSYPIHRLGPASGAWQFSRRLLPWLKQNIGRFDVVIINGLWQYYGYACLKAIRAISYNSAVQKTPKLLVMPHGMLDPYFQRAKERRSKAVRNWLYWKLIESKVMNRADGILFTCQTELLLARETFSGYYPRKEYNIGYGIHAPPAFQDEMLNSFYRTCTGINDAPYFLFLSRIHPKKGVDLLLAAYLKLFISTKSNGGSLPKLVIAGPGMDTTFGKQLRQQMAAVPGSETSIFFSGPLTGSAKWGAFYGAEMFILPSHQENFGIAVVEALACGTPVLISDQINIWKEIIDGNGGLLGKDDENGVTDLLTKWLSLSAGEKNIYRENARNVYMQHFTVTGVTDELLKVINS